MKFPTASDFWDAFGLESVESNPNMAYFRYVKSSKDKLRELFFSFSAVEESFQVTLEFQGVEIFSISSEMTKSIEINKDESKEFLRVIFLNK